MFNKWFTVYKARERELYEDIEIVIRRSKGEEARLLENLL